MAAPTAMPTEAQVLTLAQWFSPGYPIGAFTYAHGLETAVARGDVGDAKTLKTWIADVLRFGAGSSDALFLAASYRAPDDAMRADIDAQCRAFAASRERLQESDQQGAAFAQITTDTFGLHVTPAAYPVAVGHAARLHDLPLTLTSTMYLHAFTANLAAAGQRLAPIGQSAAQALITSTTPLCREIAQDTLTGDLDMLSATAFISDIAAMQHETQYARIFRT